MNPKSHSPQPEIIRSMFSRVAGRYDLANTILSLGIHHLWRKKLVNLSKAKVGQKVLDCATGTGDLAIEFKKAVGPTGEVLGTDFCVDMMTTAPKKSAAKNLDIKFEQADVMHLTSADKIYDITSISFGIRNVENPKLALQEMARVTKSGGQVIILEFGQMTIPVIGPMYDFYSKTILPQIGGLVTGQKEAYQYLQKSSAAFPCRKEFLALMEFTDAFSKMTYHSLSGGIAYIYIGRVK